MLGSFKVRGRLVANAVMMEAVKNEPPVAQSMFLRPNLPTIDGNMNYDKMYGTMNTGPASKP